jgi:hypothetical protein
MSTRFLRWMSAVTMTSAVACGPMATTPDGSTGTDASMMPPSDAAGTDAAAQPRVCDAANVVDLAMAGMRMGASTRYTGTTANAANNAMITAPTGCINGMAIRQVAHTYRVNAMGFLRASTANMGTPGGMGGHDTVVWIQDRCDTRGAMSLGCNDDAAGGTASTVTTNRLVMPGQTVTIVVATFAMSAGAPGLPYELTVEEVPPIMMGGACDPTQQSVCVENTTCVGSGQVGTCVANGSLGARCRDMNTCDMGLECIEASQDNFRCLRRAAMGGACDDVTYCPDTADCLPDGMMPGGASSGRCRERGAEGGLCAGNSMATCGMGLTCTGDAMRTGTCVREVMAGAACDPTGISTRCAMGSTCARAAMGFTCQADGSAAGTACVDGAMRCTGMGLTCSTPAMAGVCRRTNAMPGGMCDTRFGTVACAGMEACSADGNGNGTCRPVVAEGMGDNNSPMNAEAARALPLVVRGALASGDVDCFGVTLPANRAIVAQVSDGAGGCPASADSVMFLLNGAGRVISSNDDAFNLCSYLDTRDNAFTRTLPAGNYTVCVRNYDAMGMIMNYHLSVNAVPTM